MSDTVSKEERCWRLLWSQTEEFIMDDLTPAPNTEVSLVTDAEGLLTLLNAVLGRPPVAPSGGAVAGIGRRGASLRRILLTAFAALALATPASASAAMRTGSVQDPQGDAVALSGPALDIRSVAANYDDTAGTLHAVMSYYTEVADSTNDYVNVSMPVVPNQFDYASMQWGYYGGVIAAHLALYGSAGSLNGLVSLSADKMTVTMDFGNVALAGHDWQRVFGSTGSTSDTFDTFWFDGYSDPQGQPVSPPGTAAPPALPMVSASDKPVGMTINDGAQYTNDAEVTLNVVPPTWATLLSIDNDGGFLKARRTASMNRVAWKLSQSGSERLPKTVYLRFNNESQTFTDDIILDQTAPNLTGATLVQSGASGASVAMVAASRTRTFKVRLRAKDATSGVSKVQFAVRSKRHPSMLRKFKRISSYRGIRAPKYVRVRDRAGNYSAWRSIRSAALTTRE